MRMTGCQQTQMKGNERMNKRISICGIGPGNPDLIVPTVFELVDGAELIVGGQRQLAIFDTKGKQTFVFRKSVQQMIELLQSTACREIVVLVSGDTGFHSLLASIRPHFQLSELNIIPGISSFQYFFAKLGLTYNDAWLGSLHGQSIDFISKLNEYKTVFLLTDKLHHWQFIAKKLCENGLGDTKMYVGNKLSYPDETIVESTACQLQNAEYNFDLCAVILQRK